MKTKTKILSGSSGMALLLMIGLVLFTSFRSSTENEKLKLVSEIRNYLDRNVKPFMQPQRVKLDQFLSKEEKKEINQLNSRLRQLIKSRNNSGTGFLTAEEFSFSKTTAFSAQQKEAQKASRDEMRRIMAQAWTIADKHEKEINLLINEQATLFGTWERGVSSLVKDYLDDKFIFIGSTQLIKRFENRGIIRYYSPVAFLLWDPQQRFITDDLLKK